jgi:hypothetical protein
LIMAPDDIGGGVIRALATTLPDEAACLAYARRQFCPRIAAARVAAVYRDALAG